AGLRGEKVKTSLTMSNRRNRIECFAVGYCVLTQVYKPPRHHRPGFDFLPLTDPPKIKCGGWISGKGV
ncbi:MAG: hypothetical protein ACYCVX_15300, partial [Thiobacillus sp.]